MLQQNTNGKINVFGAGNSNVGKAINGSGSDQCCCGPPPKKYQLMRCDGVLSNYYIQLPVGTDPPSGLIYVGLLCYTAVTFVNATSLASSWTTTTKTCAQCVSSGFCTLCYGSGSAPQKIDAYSTASVTWGLPGNFAAKVTSADGSVINNTANFDWSSDIIVEASCVSPSYPTQDITAYFPCPGSSPWPTYFATTRAENEFYTGMYMYLSISP
jgi:hypothetical protein